MKDAPAALLPVLHVIKDSQGCIIKELVSMIADFFIKYVLKCTV